jgi:hypothetical protein
MTQSLSFSNGCCGPFPCLVRVTETEEVHPQIPLRHYLRVEASVISKCAVGDRIVEGKRLFQMRSG